MFDNYDKFDAPKFTPSGLCDFSRKMFILTSHNFCFPFHSQPLYCKCFSVHFQNLILNLVFQFHCRRMHVNLANTMSEKFLTLNNPFRNLDPPGLFNNYIYQEGNDGSVSPKLKGEKISFSIHSTCSNLKLCVLNTENN